MPSKKRKAQRRRDKRLDDGLSMLRSVVPTSSKREEENASCPGFGQTDGASILGDTVDYMKELLERIARLQGEQQPATATAALLSVSVPRELDTGHMLTPRFEVERRKEVGDTRVEISCAAKPGLLLSTADTLDALGLDVKHCVVSCFGDFAMHASCSEVRGEMLSVDAIKQQLQKNAGYGGGEEEAPQQEQ